MAWGRTPPQGGRAGRAQGPGGWQETQKSWGHATAPPAPTTATPSRACPRSPSARPVPAGTSLSQDHRPMRGEEGSHPAQFGALLRAWLGPVVRPLLVLGWGFQNEGLGTKCLLGTQLGRPCALKRRVGTRTRAFMSLFYVPSFLSLNCWPRWGPRSLGHLTVQGLMPGQGRGAGGWSPAPRATSLLSSSRREEPFCPAVERRLRGSVHRQEQRQVGQDGLGLPGHQRREGPCAEPELRARAAGQWWGGGLCRGGKAGLPLDSLVWIRPQLCLRGLLRSGLGQDRGGGRLSSSRLAGLPPPGASCPDGTEEAPGEAPGLGQVCGGSPQASRTETGAGRVVGGGLGFSCNHKGNL